MIEYKADGLGKRYDRACDVVACIFILCSVLGVISLGQYTKIADLRFLYNRALQMLSCLEDGRLPFYYYNDFNGAGYGTAFYYGQLTLYPFLPFAKAGISSFLNAYLLAALVVSYTGALSLARRFTGNYKMVALLYMGSVYMFVTTMGCWFCVTLGVGIGFFFVGACVDFFRDGKAWYRAAVLFLLILGTNTICALVGFLVCVMVMVLWFDKSRIKAYAGFALGTGLVCAYPLLNILYHAGTLRTAAVINKPMNDSARRGDSLVIGNYLSSIPVGGVVMVMVTRIPAGGFKLVNLGVLACGRVWRFVRLRGRALVALLCCLVLVVLAERYIWVEVTDLVDLRLQFPTRYMPYVMLCLLILMFREIPNKAWKFWVPIVFCLPELVLGYSMVTPLPSDYEETVTDLYCQVMNGEFVDDSFVWDTEDFYYYSSHVVGLETGTEYDYTVDKGKVIFEANERVSVPKLWYRGYRSTSGEAVMGYSQFVEVDANGYTEVWYQHPWWLICLDFFCLGVAVYYVGMIVFKRVLMGKFRQ